MEGTNPLEERDLGTLLEPVFLEPREDRWLMHRSRGLDAAQQETFKLVPRGTAEQLESAAYCGDCFPAME